VHGVNLEGNGGGSGPSGVWVWMIEWSDDLHSTCGEDKKHNDGFTIEPQNHGVDQDGRVDQVKHYRKLTKIRQGN
jgi:hypothetical protein